MSKIVLYIANSLDGFIAKPDGNLDWLTTFPPPQTGDYGYTELLQRIGKILMGRKTYDELINFGREWPYQGYETYVVTTNTGLTIKSPDTFLLTSPLREAILDLKSIRTKDIWIVGGALLLSALLTKNLLDEMIISVIPKIIGEGIPLFAGKSPASDWFLLESESFSTGLVNLKYSNKK